MKSTDSLIGREGLLALLDEAYDHKAWHGPNLKGAVRRLDAGTAAWRPASGRHTIAEIVVHAAYWKYAVRRRLRGDKRGSFPLKGSNWFALPEPIDERAWRSYLRLLDAQHAELRQTVAEFPPKRLAEATPGSQIINARLICGAAMHDIYHAGQIQTLKALQKGT